VTTDGLIGLLLTVLDFLRRFRAASLEDVFALKTELISLADLHAALSPFAPPT
jgi:hypothetical protein